MKPLKSLILGYGAAACAGLAMALYGGGILSVGAVVWIGGALGTLAAASLLPRTGAADAAQSDHVLSEALRRWEEDRLAEGADRAAGSTEARRRA